MNDTLKKQLERLPQTPGVYLFRDENNTVLYVGKAARLKARVRSYFLKRNDLPKIEVLKKKITSLEWINTPTEVEALLLEAQLIAKYYPRYNTLLKDNKTYPLLKITGETFPRVLVSRNRSEKKARYYGPYTDARLLRDAVHLINTIFPIRKCISIPKSPCLYYHLHQCLAPCINASVKRIYDVHIKEIESFLRGNKKSFIDYLKRRMQEAAHSLRYEEANMFKQQIEALKKLKVRTFIRHDPAAKIVLSASVELKKILGLKKVPERIVCFDVSNIQGAHPVASRVAFFRETEEKNAYRRYAIRTISHIDDYKMIQEALRRMCVALRLRKETFRPDLIVIDGGKGHLNAAYHVLKEEKMHTIPVIAIAKKFEMVFQIAFKEPVPLEENSPALNLLKRIRDEAHRFALAYHHKRRSKELSLSILDTISGIGPKRKQMLIKHFGSLEALKAASVEEIAHIRQISFKIANDIYEQIRRKG